MDTSNEEYNTQGTPDGNEEADTASGGSPDSASADQDLPDSTDENGRPVDNPSGG
jgi:hypothetical protein